MYLCTQHSPDVCGLLAIWWENFPVRGRNEVRLSFCLLAENLAIWKRPECREKFKGYTFCKFNCFSIKTIEGPLKKSMKYKGKNNERHKALLGKPNDPTHLRMCGKSDEVSEHKTCKN